MKIIAGLGNPDQKYETTRHNYGFLIIDKLAEAKNLNWQINKKFNAQIAKDNKVLLIKPLTYMNNSGEAIKAVMNYYKLLPKKLFSTIKDSDLTDTLTVIQDDLDIEFGKYKISTNSGSAGHNGIKSIINHLKTKNFTRVRAGIKTSALENIPTEKFVLQRFNKEELNNINNISQEIIGILS